MFVCFFSPLRRTFDCSAPEVARWETRRSRPRRVGLGRAGSCFPRFVGWESCSKVTSTYPSRGQQASSVGRRRRRRPGLGALAGVPAMAESVERLQQRVEELERELAQERSRRAWGAATKEAVRARIENMSSEVVDSNPYR